MAIFLPGAAEDQPLALEDLTPREVVRELDKYVIGQDAAKRAVAVALRNRTRRQRLPPELAEEVMPKNILMIGSTGVGKTEIARRLARLTNSPFLKVEASKFTEVGYVGRDVESIVRDLVEIAIDDVREERLEEIEDRAESIAEERLIEMLLLQGGGAENGPIGPAGLKAVEDPPAPVEGPEARAHLAVVGGKEDTEKSRERDRLRQLFREGRLDDRMVEVDLRDRQPPTVEIVSNSLPEEMDPGPIKEMITGMLSGRTRKRPMKVSDAFEALVDEEEGRLLDMDAITRTAVERVEDSGIVFLDEIDKIAGREGGHGPDISREGVQRDILPIVEGTTVNTKYGFVTTDHILFIAAGAFHVSKPSDLIPELQGRFPIRVELKALTVNDFLRILTEPRASLVKQSVALLETEGLRLEFAPEALAEMARFAFEVNEQTENIGARRLHTILEKVLDQVSFHAPDLVRAARSKKAEEPLPEEFSALPSLERLTEVADQQGSPEFRMVVDRAYVELQVAEVVKNQDLSRYML